MTCLFGAELPPSVLFGDKREYLEAKNQIFYRLGLDPNYFEQDWKNGEVNRRSRSPSPIRRLEESLLLVGRVNDNLSVNLDMTSQYSGVSNLDESVMSIRSSKVKHHFDTLSTKKQNLASILMQYGDRNDK